LSLVTVEAIISRQGEQGRAPPFDALAAAPGVGPGLTGVLIANLALNSALTLMLLTMLLAISPALITAIGRRHNAAERPRGWNKA